MTNRKPPAGLDIVEDPAFQRRFWTVQRAGRVVMAATIVAALAGLLGRGPASRAVLHGDGARAAYERVVHAGTPTTLTLDLERRGGSGASGEARIALDRHYVEEMGLQRVVPAPVRVEVDAQVLTYVFGSDGTLHATFDLKPAAPGIRRTPVQMQGRALGVLVQTVLP